MIGRRNLMAMIGLAPVAAISSPVPVLESCGNSVTATSDLSPVEYARKRLAAVKYARSIGIEPDHGPSYLSMTDCVEAEVSAMRSWSAATKQRVVGERRFKRYQDNYISEAVARVEREVKLSLAPEWIRRFM